VLLRIEDLWDSCEKGKLEKEIGFVFKLHVRMHLFIRQTGTQLN
jgi:hypothetical protein